VGLFIGFNRNIKHHPFPLIAIATLFEAA